MDNKKTADISAFNINKTNIRRKFLQNAITLSFAPLFGKSFAQNMNHDMHNMPKGGMMNHNMGNMPGMNHKMGNNGGVMNAMGIPNIIKVPQKPRPLAIPQLIADTQNFNLKAQKGVMDFLDGKKTATLGINGNYLAPALKVKKGQEISINVENALAEPTTMHWHGMIVPGNMDGGPHQLIPAGKSWKANYVIRQGAATNWFHPHAMGYTASQVYAGMAGLLIVEDDNSDNMDLPKTWGEDDIALVVQDRRFSANGEFAYLSNMMDVMNGMHGETIIVNGTINPFVNLPAKEIRLRILNGSNARVYNFAFADSRPFFQIATDNGFINSPIELTEINLSPGERAEIIVDFSKAGDKSFDLIDKLSGGKVLSLNINKPAKVQTKLPTKLNNTPDPDIKAAKRTREFVLTMNMAGMMQMQFMINNKQIDHKRIDEKVPFEETEIWSVTNKDAMADTMAGMMHNMNHNFHIHGGHFQIIERDGSVANVAKYEKGLKDTVFIPSNSNVKFLVKFDTYKNPDHPYMYHCHFLEHEDNGMMGQFVVV